MKTIDHQQTVDSMASFRAMTGGFDYHNRQQQSASHSLSVGREKDSETQALGDITVKSGQPPTVESFGLRALPPGVQPVDVALDAEAQKKTIDGVASAIG